MPNPYFRFKQFTVFQDKCAMKVGIDGVLLGAWADVKNAMNILDIGTGTGLIALMMAQRTEASITAIDIEENAVRQAKENIANSPWHENIQIEQTSLQAYSKTCGQKFDLIVSNPPFFNNSLKAPDQKRNTARHTDTLSHTDLIDKASDLLTDNGRICLIFPVPEGEKCIEYALRKGLALSRKIEIHAMPHKPAHRLLIELSKQKCETTISRLTIETGERHCYTEEFSHLLKDYYLKL